MTNKNAGRPTPIQEKKSVTIDGMLTRTPRQTRGGSGGCHSAQLARSFARGAVQGQNVIEALGGGTVHLMSKRTQRPLHSSRDPEKADPASQKLLHGHFIGRI